MSISGEPEMETIDFSFLQHHSDRFLEMAFRTDRDGRLYNPDASASNTGGCGDSIEIFLTVDEKDVIDSVAFAIDGCINTRACANGLGDLIENKPVQYAWSVTPEAIASELETLAAEHFHCAELAAGALYKALTRYRTLSRDPWKKSYMK